MRPSVTFMISEPCTCCQGTGRVSALETDFSKIERKICRLLVSKSFSAPSPLIPHPRLLQTGLPLLKIIWTRLLILLFVICSSIFSKCLTWIFLEWALVHLPDIATSFGNHYLWNRLHLDTASDIAIAFSFSGSLKIWHGSFCNKICASICLANMITLDRRE